MNIDLEEGRVLVAGGLDDLLSHHTAKQRRHGAQHGPAITTSIHHTGTTRSHPS